MFCESCSVTIRVLLWFSFLFLRGRDTGIWDVPTPLKYLGYDVRAVSDVTFDEGTYFFHFFRREHEVCGKYCGFRVVHTGGDPWPAARSTSTTCVEDVVPYFVGDYKFHHAVVIEVFYQDFKVSGIVDSGREWVDATYVIIVQAIGSDPESQETS